MPPPAPALATALLTPRARVTPPPAQALVMALRMSCLQVTPRLPPQQRATPELPQELAPVTLPLAQALAPLAQTLARLQPALALLALLASLLLVLVLTPVLETPPKACQR